MTVAVKTEHGDFWDALHPTQKVNVSLPDGTFKSYKSVDDAVNDLFLNGHKELARAINKEFKNETTNSTNS